MQITKKPIEMEAVQWTGTQESLEEIKKLGSERIVYHKISGSLFIRTFDESLEVGIDDWVIKGANGGIYPCKPDMFEETYDKEAEV